MQYNIQYYNIPEQLGLSDWSWFGRGSGSTHNYALGCSVEIDWCAIMPSKPMKIQENAFSDLYVNKTENY